MFGTLLGSFLNVCVYRLPRKESIVWPRSYCIHCKSTIPLWYNIPIISYILLRGKCRFCKSRIPYLYPLLELLTGALLVLVWLHYGLTASFVHYSVLILLLLPISFIDLNHKLILNVLTFPGIVIGLLLGMLTNETWMLQGIFGTIAGGGFLWLIGLFGKVLFKQESMGGGDIKLAAMVGTFIGPQVLIALFLAFFLALPVVVLGLVNGRIRPGSTLPFGPFISLATVVVVCFGQSLYEFYLDFMGYI
ncbi:MAG: prepilin peptidase [bacterium]